MKRFFVKPQAERDLIEHYAYIALDKINPALRLLEIADDSFQRLADMPGMGRRWHSANPNLAGLRVYPLPHGYRNYLVFYRPIADGIEIIRILHAARDVGSILDELDLK